MTEKSHKALNVLLWLAQGTLAATFLWAGFMKLFLPGSLPFPWVRDSPALAAATGFADLMAGIGIILPALLKTRINLTVLAAYGIMALMAAATVFHVSRGEAKDIGFNMLMLAMSIFIAWGRQKPRPRKRP